MATAEESLLAAAMLCGMRHRYRDRGYESIEKAKVALRRRCRPIAKDQLETAFTQGMAFYDRAEELVWANRRQLSAEGFGGLEWQLLQEFPAAADGVVRDALNWAYYGRILR